MPLRYFQNLFESKDKLQIQRGYLTIGQAAKEIGLNEERIRELVKLKMVPVNKSGIKQKDLFEFMVWEYWYYPQSCVIAKMNSVKKYFESLQNQGGPKKNIHTLYINIPFCKSFCTFCIWPKYLFNKDKIQDYLQALKQEITFYSKSKYVKSKNFFSVYLGGGTPSCLSSKQLVELLNWCKDNFNISKEASITVEGTPATFSVSKMEVLYRRGVERLSFGVQTFNDELGRLLNLPQDSKKVFEILRLARRIGFKHLDIDLIYNLPGQTMVDHLQDLKIAVELRLDSITCYQLGLRYNTKLYWQLKSKEVPMIDFSLSALLKTEFAAHKLLTNAGYEQVTHYRDRYYTLQKNYNNKEQTSMKETGDDGYSECLGLGADAKGFLNNCSYTNTGLSEYIRKINKNVLPVRSIIHLSKKERMRRIFLTGLCSQGWVNKKRFLEEFNENPEIYFSNIINYLKKRKMIQVSDSEISLSFLGKLYWEEVYDNFLKAY